LLHRTDANIGIVEEVTEKFCGSFDVPRERVYAIPNSVDIKRIQEALKERVEVREQLRIRPVEIAVGLVGNLREEKNHKTLIEALAILKDKYPNLILVFAGSGDQEESQTTRL
jgi:glycosyltransferase involved in cell wall biosynthesis